MSARNDVPRRRLFLEGGLLAVAGILRPPATLAHAEGVAHAGHGERPAVHGMVVLGDRRIYLSHLPLFRAPHDYQAILEASFGGEAGKAAAAYRADRATTGEHLYTFEPERFVLQELVAGTEPRRSFRGTLYRGHFERGGEPIARDVAVEVARVVHFRKLDPGLSRPARLTYLLFGGEHEAFLAHRVVRPPDFDQLLSVTPLGEVPEQDLRAGIEVGLEGPDAWERRVRPGGEVRATIPSATTAARVLRIAVQAELYAEAGELAS